jgi:hypothetical protein
MAMATSVITARPPPAAEVAGLQHNRDARAVSFNLASHEYTPSVLRNDDLLWPARRSAVRRITTTRVIDEPLRGQAIGPIRTLVVDNDDFGLDVLGNALQNSFDQRDDVARTKPTRRLRPARRHAEGAAQDLPRVKAARAAGQPTGSIASLPIL